jgi:hypothetical protein
MQVTSKPIMISELIEQKFEVVQQFKYLGAIVTNDNNLDKEIRYQISLANNCFHGLKHLFRSLLNLRTKLNLYITLLKPVLMVVSVGRLTEEMRNSYRYLREGF